MKIKNGNERRKEEVLQQWRKLTRWSGSVNGWLCRSCIHACICMRMLIVPFTLCTVFPLLVQLFSISPLSFLPTSIFSPFVLLHHAP